VIVFAVFNYTRFGFYLTSIGNNPEGVRVLGINISKYIVLSYVISGFFMGIASTIIMAKVQYISVDLGGRSLLLDSIAAIVIGGVAIGGGRGRILGVFWGVLAIAIINNMVNLANMSFLLDQFFKGAVIILVLIINRVLEIANVDRK